MSCILKENIGVLLTNKTHEKNIVTVKNKWLPKIEERKKSGSQNFVSAIDKIKTVLAGVANPLKYCIWVLSTLNFANLRAEKRTIQIENNSYQKVKGNKFSLIFVLLNNKIIIQVGTNPKLTTSAKESNSLPKSDLMFNALAANPSKKSNTKEPHMKIAISLIL